MIKKNLRVLLKKFHDEIKKKKKMKVKEERDESGKKKGGIELKRKK